MAICQIFLDQRSRRAFLDKSTLFSFFSGPIFKGPKILFSAQKSQLLLHLACRPLSNTPRKCAVCGDGEFSRPRGFACAVLTMPPEHVQNHFGGFPWALVRAPCTWREPCFQQRRARESRLAKTVTLFRGVLLSGWQAKRSKFCDFWAENRSSGPLNIGLETKLNRVDLSRKARRLRWSKNIWQMATH